MTSSRLASSIFSEHSEYPCKAAKQQLAEQALRDIDAIWNMTLGEDNEAAQAFIAENVKGTTFENTHGEQQTLFSTQNGDFYDPSRYAADSLKADPELYRNAQQTAKERTGELLSDPDKLKAAIEDKFDVSKEDLIQMGSDIIDEMADKGVVEIITERYTDPIIAGAQGIETYTSVDGTTKETFDGIYGEGAGTVIKDAALPAAAAAVVIGSKDKKRPSWRESEKDEASIRGDDTREQVSYKDREEVPCNTPGCVKPDIVSNNTAIEVKNYDLSRPGGENGLVNNVSKQVNQRCNHLPCDMTQEVVIDIRGQNITASQRDSIRQQIIDKTNGTLKSEDIIFRRDN